MAIDRPGEVGEEPTLGLLVDSGRAGSEAMTQPSQLTWQPATAGPGPGQIHRYVVLEEIGRGGMGVVYRALDPDLDREIAIKLLTAPDGDSDSGERPDGTGVAHNTRDKMFREAQALAKLSHPNVIAVHDVGTFEGDVFLAMEFVPGDTVHRWCQRKPRSWREVVDVFVAAGEGLAAAHARGIVHRDFKPTNVLVGDDGRVRVIDFGLARAADADAPPGEAGEPDKQDDSDGGVEARLAAGSGYQRSALQRSLLQTPLTTVGLVCGTPHYMAPEQHLGGTASEATDQFSFCASLYEALYRERPFGADGRPARPSATAVRNASRRSKRTVPVHIHRACMRGLSLRSDERFPSMALLLRELKRDPARKRRRLALGAAVALSLAFGSWSAIAGRDDGSALLCQGAAEELTETWNPERRAAIEQAFLATGVSYAKDTFERVASTLDDYGKNWVDMRTQACQATHIKGLQSEKVLDLRMACLDRKRQRLQALVGLFTDKPDRQVIDKAVEASLGLGGLAFCADTKALEQEVEPPEKPEDRRILAELRGRLEEVDQLNSLGKYRVAQALLEDVSPRVEQFGFPPLQAELAWHTARTLRLLGEYAKSEQPLKDAIQLALQWGMNELAAEAGARAAYVVGCRLQRYNEGLIYALHSVGLTRDRGDELEALSLSNLAIIYRNQGKLVEAEELHKRALAIREKALGPRHPYVARSLHNLASAYQNQGKYVEAEELNKRALAIREKALGPDHPVVAYSLNSLAYVYYKQGKRRAAEQLYKRALAIREKALGPEHPRVAEPLFGLAEIYEKERRFAEAQPLLERVRNIAKAPKDRAQATFASARVMWALGGDRPRARSLAQEALTLLQTAEQGEGEEYVEVEQWIAEHR